MTTQISLQDGTVLDVARYPLPDGLPDGVLNRTEMAIAMNVSENTITKWTSQGMPMIGAGSNGRSYEYQLSQCYAWRMHRSAQAESEQSQRNKLAQQAALAFRNLDDGEEDESQGLTAKGVREWSEAELRRMTVAERRGELMRTNRVRQAFEDIFVATQGTFSTFPDFMERELGLTAKEVATVQDYCDQQLIELRRSISEAVETGGHVADFGAARQGEIGL